jgi:hypothetical protein
LNLSKRSNGKQKRYQDNFFHSILNKNPTHFEKRSGLSVMI